MTQSKKPPADLSAASVLITKKGMAGVPADASQRTPPPVEAQSVGQEEVELLPLNFRVPADFKRRFRMFAAERNMKLTDVLKQAFDLLESQK
jgi:hypothetical protein